MRHPSLIAVVILLLVLLGGAAGVYAYDSSRQDRIARGITVGDLDLGGLTAAQAQTVLERRLERPLHRPVKVRVRGRTFGLSARRARVRTDVEGTVAEAVRMSREGNLVTRTARDLTGGEVRADLDPRVSYSRRAVARLARRVKRAVDRPVAEASVVPSGSGLSTSSGRAGLVLDGRRLRRQVAQELVLPGDRTVRPRVRRIRSSVTMADLRRRYPVYVTIDRTGHRLRLYRRLRLARTYTIAVGQAGLETPPGLHQIQTKEVDPVWHVPKRAWAGRLAGRTIPGGRPDNPLKARWMGLVDGAGIHGTEEVSSLGTNASHGCIRMSVPEVKDLFDRVSIGSPVYIA